MVEYGHRQFFFSYGGTITTDITGKEKWNNNTKNSYKIYTEKGNEFLANAVLGLVLVGNRENKSN